MTDLYTKLEELADLRAAPTALALELEDKTRLMIGEQAYSNLLDLRREYGNLKDAAEAEAAALEAEIKAEVIQVGATVKSAHLQAVWNKGRVTWDGAKLDGMLALIPALAAARKEGEPTVTIRIAK